MDLQKNAFKAALARRDRQVGLWSALRAPVVAEILSRSGFDWILLDTEHAPNEIPDLIGQMQAMAGGTATPVVRVAWNDAVLIKRVLDAGAQSLLVPFVQTPEEAAAAVAATRYPPDGIRGVSGSSRSSQYGRIANYLARAGEETCVTVQVETGEALERIEEIAAVPGVDGVFIGPADLAASLGHLGDIGAAPVQAAIRDAAARLGAVGKAAGILTPVEAEARRYLDWGYSFVAVGLDHLMLRLAADAAAAAYRD